jgi:uncharacterized membrane protein YgdD (TMEM256/DUF423 family)
MTILLASVLLFVGIASKMHSIRARGMLLVVGGVLFISSLTIALTLPKEI